jgi:hypothetical protein
MGENIPFGMVAGVLGTILKGLKPVKLSLK